MNGQEVHLHKRARDTEHYRVALCRDDVIVRDSAPQRPAAEINESMVTIRTTTATTAQCADAILAYAKHPALKHLRLAVTKRYVHASEFPPEYTNGTLVHNSPLLLAVADLDFDLPYAKEIAGVPPIAVVIDSPAMTRQRSHRASEVDSLLDALLALQLHRGKIAYAVQPVGVTEHLAAVEARNTILAASYQDFHRPDDATDLKRRLGG